MKRYQQGFSLISVLLLVFMLSILLAIGYTVLIKRKTVDAPQNTSAKDANQQSSEKASAKRQDKEHTPEIKYSVPANWTSKTANSVTGTITFE